MKWPLVSRARYDAAVAVADHTAEELIGTRIVNDCLTDANLAVARRLTRALKACRRYRKALAAEQRRADQLQRRLDDAVGLKPRQIEDSSRWQPGYKAPQEDRA